MAQYLLPKPVGPLPLSEKKLPYAKGTKKWYDIIDTLVDNYNSAYHSTIKAKPKDVFYSDGVGTCQIAKNIKAAVNKMVNAGTVTTGVSKKKEQKLVNLLG